MSDGRHQYFNDPAVGRLMGSLLALTGELFVAKAEIEVLKKALAARGLLSESDLVEAAGSEEHQAYLASERAAYAEHVFEPLRVPDQAMEQHWQLYGPGPDPDTAADPDASREPVLASSQASS
jgi:hypothetical protein